MTPTLILLCVLAYAVTTALILSFLNAYVDFQREHGKEGSYQELIASLIDGVGDASPVFLVFLWWAIVPLLSFIAAFLYLYRKAYRFWKVQYEQKLKGNTNANGKEN